MEIFLFLSIIEQKKRGSHCQDSGSLLGGGYLRLPASLTVGVVTLRALCQEWGQERPPRSGRKKTRGNIRNGHYLS